MARFGPRLFILVSAIACCHGYKMFQSNLPNGDKVPHPCKSNYIWKGVGHQNVAGGGARNPFGLAFKAAGVTWTQELCEADSDGDGKTNGEELGDPGCVWTEGDAAMNRSALSHPGVCEPTDSADCLTKNSWDIDCSEGSDFTCEGIADSETINVTLKFDKTTVPANETTYICQSFSLPDDKVYHLFAQKPEIDNENVMHHTLMYGCSVNVSGFDSPQECNMGGYQCQMLLGAWTIGSNGVCQSKDNGFLVGKGYFTTVMIQHHWNNPSLRLDYEDESGLTLFLTPKLRKNNLGYLWTGQLDIDIPANKEAHTLGGVCSGSCLATQEESIYITSAHLHMHYLGSSGKIEHWRNGELVNNWFDESSYNYELPVFNVFNPPIEVKPGDQIRTICTYKSTSKSEVTNFGEATSDEMCFGLMNYYPAKKGPGQCLSYGNNDFCRLKAEEMSTDHPTRHSTDHSASKSTAYSAKNSTDHSSIISTDHSSSNSTARSSSNLAGEHANNYNDYLDVYVDVDDASHNVAVQELISYYILSMSVLLYTVMGVSM